MAQRLLLAIVRAETTPLRIYNLGYLSIKFSHSVLPFLLTFFISFFLLSLTTSCFLFPYLYLLFHSFFSFFLLPSSFPASPSFYFIHFCYFQSLIHSYIHSSIHAFIACCFFLSWIFCFFISPFYPYFLFIVSLWFSFPSIFSFFIYFSSFHVLSWWTLFCKRGKWFHMLSAASLWQQSTEP